MWKCLTGSLLNFIKFETVSPVAPLVNSKYIYIEKGKQIFSVFLPPGHFNRKCGEQITLPHAPSLSVCSWRYAVLTVNLYLQQSSIFNFQQIQNAHHSRLLLVLAAYIEQIFLEQYCMNTYQFLFQIYFGNGSAKRTRIWNDDLMHCQWLQHNILENFPKSKNFQKLKKNINLHLSYLGSQPCLWSRHNFFEI